MELGTKALSPIIATVILISLVVTLSIIVWIFLGGFIKELVVKQEKSADAVCLDEVEISASVEDLSLDQVIVSNDGDAPIAGVNIWVKASGGEGRQKFYNCPLESGAASAELCAFTTGEDFSDLISGCEKVTITPVLLGKGQKSGKYQRSACDTKAKSFEC